MKIYRKFCLQGPLEQSTQAAAMHTPKKTATCRPCTLGPHEERNLVALIDYSIFFKEV